MLRTLLEPDRLAVVGSVARVPRTAAEVAEVTGVRPRDVLRTLAPLVHAGLVTEVDGTYRVDGRAWRSLSVELPRPEVHPRIGFGMTEDERRILARHFRGEHLDALPARRDARLVVLERLALEFGPGERFDEREVNRRLGRFNADHSSLRRALVDEGLLTREPGLDAEGRSTQVYWRTGGRTV